MAYGLTTWAYGQATIHYVAYGPLVQPYGLQPAGLLAHIRGLWPLNCFKIKKEIEDEITLLPL